MEFREPRSVDEAARLLLDYDKPSFGIEVKRREQGNRYENKGTYKPSQERRNFDRKPYTKNPERQDKNNTAGERFDRNKKSTGDKKIRVINDHESSEDEHTDDDFTYVPDEESENDSDEEQGAVDENNQAEVRTIQQVVTNTPVEIGERGDTFITEQDFGSDSDDNMEKETNVCPVIDLVINGVQVSALLDTGAQLSAISETLMERVEKGVKTFKKLNAPSTVVRGALGNKTTINKQVLMEIMIDDTEILHPGIAIKKLSNPLIPTKEWLVSTELNRR